VPWVVGLDMVGHMAALVVEGLGGAGVRGFRRIMGERFMSDAVDIVTMSYLFRLFIVACRYQHDMRLPSYKSLMAENETRELYS
jgi:hypothetical protein